MHCDQTVAETLTVCACIRPCARIGRTPLSENSTLSVAVTRTGLRVLPVVIMTTAVIVIGKGILNRSTKVADESLRAGIDGIMQWERAPMMALILS